MSFASGLLWGAEKKWSSVWLSWCQLNANVMPASGSRKARNMLLSHTVLWWQTLSFLCDPVIQGQVARKIYDEARTHDTAIWIKLARNSELRWKRKELYSNERKGNRENANAHFCDIRVVNTQAHPMVSCSQLSCRNFVMQTNFPCCTFLKQCGFQSLELHLLQVLTEEWKGPQAEKCLFPLLLFQCQRRLSCGGKSFRSPCQTPAICYLFGVLFEASPGSSLKPCWETVVWAERLQTHYMFWPYKNPGQAPIDWRVAGNSFQKLTQSCI